MGLTQLFGAIFLLAASTTAYRKEFGNQTLPVVDLGYELYQASNFNESGRFYNFSNIRFAAKPVRFGLPQDPEINRTQIRDGNDGRACPQSGPAWFYTGQSWLSSIVLGTTCDACFTPYVPPGASWNLPLAAPDPREMEDCLFLDLFVPERALKSAGKGRGAAVLVWFYGGGYTFGRKENNPAGLLAAAASGKGNITDSGDSDIIYISVNYRLGAMGFSSGPTFRSEGGIPNLGLLDQRFALEWIQKYVHLFGGDKDRVTLFGESSGGGSIMHQITAYGGKDPVPFRRAISQSGGWVPTSPKQQEDTYQLLLNLTNSSSIADLRNVSEPDFMRANALIVGYNTTYSNFLYNPVVDGDFAPQLPGELLAQGAFDKTVLVAHEGDFFTAPYLNTSEAIRASLVTIFPYMSSSSLDYIMTTLYPPVFNGSYGYTTQYDRATLIIAESIIICNAKYLSDGFNNNLYSYLFTMPPAYHGFDNLYTYYDGGAVSDDITMVMNRTVAVVLQQLITSFAKTGIPEADGVGQISKYGADARVLQLNNATGFQEVRDKTSASRSSWWQTARYS
ncbi:carboxylesterase family protein-like protein [Lophiotrema nucula]|uniref:Carboxylic ester hydrolase n=1 Tax=Lophiotrema nucula TaxID=690887 RepID=A0A6A5ZBG6_9PLEO|nr:carboxylesterase family protein-like protein [Lophiotrema nucula]